MKLVSGLGTSRQIAVDQAVAKWEELVIMCENDFRWYIHLPILLSNT